MGWKGIAAGMFIGHCFGGPPGALLGAIVGHFAEREFMKEFRGARHHSQGRPRGQVFVGSAAAMFAKMSKVDGVVTRSEIASVENAFRRLGFTPAARSYAVSVFRKAKDDGRTIYQYAQDFAAAVDSVEVRELFYEILWDIACADGTVSPAELLILQRIPRALGIRIDWYAYFASQRLGTRSGGPSAPRDPLANAYAILGASANDGADELKRKYRELAKRNHPDALRAQGLPEEMVGKATERMSRINEAWAAIKAARGL